MFVVGFLAGAAAGYGFGWLLAYATNVLEDEVDAISDESPED